MSSLKIPKNLCVIPFVHLSSKTDGKIRICCFSQDFIHNDSNQYLCFGKDSLEKIWNGSGMRRIRKQMLRGEKLKGCENCWREERHGKISKRIRENNKYLAQVQDTLQEAQNNKGWISKKPLYLDLRLGNICNLKCRTCNPALSSLWYKEIKQKKSENKLTFTREDLNSFEEFDPKKINKWYKTDIMFDSIREISRDLKRLYISGGEPFLIKEHQLFLKYFIRRKLSSNISIYLNTNLTHLDKNLLGLLYQFKKVFIDVSIDAYGVKNDWIRFPSRFSMIERNLKKLLLKSAENMEVTINCTVSIFNILYLDELCKWSVQIHQGNHKKPLKIHFDLLHQPKNQQLILLPSELKKRAIDKLNQIKKSYPFSVEKKDIMGLIQMLNSSLSENEEIKDLRRFLKQEIEMIDIWRDESFFKTFSDFQAYL